MLEWIWTLISLAVMTVSILTERDGANRFLDGTLLGLSAMVFALAFSWPMTGALFLGWLNATIPQQGTEIHEFTVSVILGLVYLFVFIAFPVSVTCIKNKIRKQ